MRNPVCCCRKAVFVVALSVVGSMAFHPSTFFSARTGRRTGLIARRAIDVALNHPQGLPTSALFQSVKEEIDPGVVEGTNLKIVKYPHPALRATNVEVTATELKDGSMARLAKEMFLVMYAANGVGLAAPQVGVNKRLMVYNESGDKKKWLDEV